MKKLTFANLTQLKLHDTVYNTDYNTLYYVTQDTDRIHLHIEKITCRMDNWIYCNCTRNLSNSNLDRFNYVLVETEEELVQLMLGMHL